ncbi:MAG: hypothetical protein QXP88_00350 [Thermoproteota archaeon]
MDLIAQIQSKGDCNCQIKDKFELFKDENYFYVKLNSLFFMNKVDKSKVKDFFTSRKFLFDEKELGEFLKALE